KPMTSDLRITGPVLANLWVTTTARDAVVSVRITDVAPDGTSKEMSAGWLAASFRKIDPAKSRSVHGQLLQPFHPFTRESVEPVGTGNAALSVGLGSGAGSEPLPTPAPQSPRSPVKPRLRGVVHQLAFWVAALAGALLVAFAPSGHARLPVAIYVATLCGLLG